ncbi:hypothetical protein OESDEN_01965 [Oesophagostomum dentatum]|uniref:Uncharacterized protein n=1 Tax=Oesophagostomum dentatum TaxID=61180 RepID=A0A0B1TQF8_OESDE|nr:hypothetical protein OESDEN_01965 [Oesophagostomum dentatum]
MLEEERSESDSEPICRPPPLKKKRTRSKARKPPAHPVPINEDSDEEMTTEQMEERRYLCQQRMLKAEKQFNHLKIVIRDLKLKELEIKKSMIANRTAPEFLERANELRRHYKKKEEVAKTRRTLSLDSLERRTIGQRYIARFSQEDNIVNAKIANID